jgi:HAD superfamily hydrolase (TIGR01509 family)
MSKALNFIFFDVGHTLLFPDWNLILQPLAVRGCLPTSDHLRAIDRKTRKAFDESASDAGSPNIGFWRVFHSHLLESLGISDNALLDSLVAAMAKSDHWNQIRPGTRDVLQGIGANFSMAVISNSDGGVARVLHRCGIGDCFRKVIDSGAVGYEKPHPAIFKMALDAVGAQAEESVYVGDVYCVDYVGATRAGMQSILFDIAGVYRDTGLPRVESLDELKTSLQI